MLSKCLQILHQRPIWTLGFLFFAGMSAILYNFYFLSRQINEEMVTQSASLYTETLGKFRAYYSANIVNRVNPEGIRSAYDFKNHEGAIPFPATMSIELGYEISAEDGVEARLYSNYPFPWRIDGGPHDEFEKAALIALNNNPKEPYVRFEEIDGRRSLRYARAILMDPSCIECHNSDPASPKKDWKVGDVRGAQELTMSIDSIDSTVQQGLLRTLGLMIAITVSALALLALVLKALRSSLREVRRLAAETEEANKNLEVVNKAFSRFVPHEIPHFLHRADITKVELGDATEIEMSVLFSDIRSFTTMSEAMSPQDNFKFLNSYLKWMEPAVRENHGFIDKFIGDAIMALFDQNADDAIKGANAMLRSLRVYNYSRKVAGYVPIEIGIGINTGNLMLGTIGGQYRMQGTAISDAVNLASRIEGLTKVYGAALLVSDHTVKRLADKRSYKIRFIDQVRVKGKTQPVVLYEVCDSDPLDIQDMKMGNIDNYQEGWDLYFERNFEEAQIKFQACLDAFPEDKPAQVFLQRCKDGIVVE